MTAATTVRSIVSDDLRVIMCLAFDRRAPTDQISAFKKALIECPMVVHSVEVTGTFDFMIEAALPDIATYNEKLEAIRETLARLVSCYEANFVWKRFVRSPAKEEHALWVPCHDGLRRIDCCRIDKVTAEGDYMRVHSGGESWLVHTTMRNMLAKLGEHDFVHVHRSTVVRCDFIERLIHEGCHWTARLNDGTLERIAKSHVASVLGTLRIDLAKPRGGSSKDRVVNENLMQPDET